MNSAVFSPLSDDVLVSEEVYNDVSHRFGRSQHILRTRKNTIARRVFERNREIS
jgi:hypothetical protein